MNTQNSNSDNNMKPLLEHFQELRSRLIKVLIIFVFFLLLSYFTTPYFLDVVKISAIEYGISVNVFKITESVSIYIKIMVLQSICVTLPVLIFQITQFISPAIEKGKQIFLVISTLFVILLFVIGVILALLYLVPLLIAFFLGVSNSLEINTVYGLSDYLNFVITITISSGLILQLPIFICMLSLMKIVTTDTLRRSRRIFYPALCLLAVIVTPPDFVSDILVTSLLFILFELSIFLSRILTKIFPIAKIEAEVNSTMERGE